MTHFELFGLTPSVDIDVAKLEATYRSLSLELHPDRLVDADAKTRRMAAEKTASLNEGLKVLKDPERRATYLLSLQGIFLDADSFRMPSAFLQEIMEQREQLERLKLSRQLDDVHRLAEHVRSNRDSSLNTAHEALRRHDVTSAAHALGRARYYTRLLEEVDAFEEECLS